MGGLVVFGGISFYSVRIFFLVFNGLLPWRLVHRGFLRGWAYGFIPLCIVSDRCIAHFVWFYFVPFVRFGSVRSSVRRGAINRASTDGRTNAQPLPPIQNFHSFDYQPNKISRLHHSFNNKLLYFYHIKHTSNGKI